MTPSSVLFISPTNIQRMTELAQTFPTLRGRPGTDPFNPDKLDTCTGLSHGGQYAAQFLLAVWSGTAGRPADRPRATPIKDQWKGVYRWNMDTAWRKGIFDAVQALQTWDAVHREAFLAWARDPWWP